MIVSLNDWGKWPVDILCCARARMWYSRIERHRFNMWLGISSGPGALFGASLSMACLIYVMVISKFVDTGSG